jgi:3-deoxy-D-manno-octulosonate 8-phosphate phosphatase (KDO 8-P phosphatase)
LSWSQTDVVLAARAREITLVALDVDGVLTDDGFHWGPNGEEWKRFSFLDVMGISRAQKGGIAFALVSGEVSPLVNRYAAKMSIGNVITGCKDKRGAIIDLAVRLRLVPAQVAFIGNDVNDLEALAWVGFSATPADAHPSVRARVHYVARAPGGRGAVREILDLLLFFTALGYTAGGTCD